MGELLAVSGSYRKDRVTGMEMIELDPTEKVVLGREIAEPESAEHPREQTGFAFLDPTEHVVPRLELPYPYQLNMAYADRTALGP